jgi:hypothetical protein
MLSEWANMTSYEIRADMVNNPEHYTNGNIECIDALQSMLTEEEFIGFLRGNSFKYHWRLRNKDNPIQDLEKAKWYDERLEKLLREKSDDRYET